MTVNFTHRSYEVPMTRLDFYRAQEQVEFDGFRLFTVFNTPANNPGIRPTHVAKTIYLYRMKDDAKILHAIDNDMEYFGRWDSRTDTYYIMVRVQ